MKPRAYIVHRVPGRVRFKLVGHRRERSYFDQIEHRLKRLPAVKEVVSNPLTGSVLVKHEGEIADLATEAFGADIGELVDFVLHTPPLAHRIGSEMGEIDRRIRSLSGDEIDLGTLASIALLAMAGLQLMRGGQPAAAVSLGWYATELLRRSATV